MNDMISIIIPIYNAQETLKRCIDSVISQTHKNIEVILINDGSTDNSAIICKNYLKTDKRIMFLEQDNHGLSSARNLGLEHANGDYISFVDSDDFIEKNMYTLLLNSIKENKSDIAICNVFFDNNIFNSKHSELVFYRNEYPEKAYYINTISGFVWNRLYSRRMIYYKNNSYVSFEKNNKMCEDDLFNYEVFNKNKNIKYSYINTKLYHYVFNKNSVTNKKFHFDKLDYFDVREREIELLESNAMNSDFLKADYIIHFTRTKIILKKLNIKPNQKFEKIKNKSIEFKKQIKYKNLLLILKIKLFIATRIPLIYRIKLINQNN